MDNLQEAADVGKLSERQKALRDQYNEALQGMKEIEFTKDEIEAIKHIVGEAFHKQWKKDKNKTIEQGHWRSAKFTNDAEKEHWEGNHPNLLNDPLVYRKDTGEVNLLALDNEDLPPEWAKENLEPARVIVEILLMNIHGNRQVSFDDLADLIHQNWMIRNSENLFSLLPENAQVKKIKEKIAQFEHDPNISVAPIADIRAGLTYELELLAASLPESEETSYAKSQFKKFRDLSEDQKFLDERQIVLALQEMRTYALTKVATGTSHREA